MLHYAQHDCRKGRLADSGSFLAFLCDELLKKQGYFITKPSLSACPLSSYFIV